MSVRAYLTANTITAYTARQERLNGINYLVAPVVLLVEGVHRGSAGSVFYPLNELQAFPGAWDGRPVTLQHPEIDGQPVGASTPEAMKLFHLGMLLHTHYDSSLGGLRSEVWLDMDRARRIAPDVLEAMLEGKSLEVSTGLWFEAHGGPGMWGNETFETTATGFRPDHLALLPGAVGACSISDGCGLRANKMEGGKVDMNIRARARRPSFDGTGSAAWGAPSWGEIVAGYNRATGSSVATSVDVADAPQALKSWAAKLSLLGDENANDFSNLVFFPVVNPANRELNENALRAVLSGRSSQAGISVPTQHSARELTLRLLNSEFDAGLEITGNKGLFERFMDYVKNESEPKEAQVARLMERFAANQPGMVSTVKALQSDLDAMDRETPNGFLVHWLEEAFDDGTFIMRQEGPEGTKFFKGSFTMTENEGVQIEGGFTEVRVEKEFVDVINGAQTINKEGKNVSNSNKETIVNGLIACGNTVFNETHRAGLMAMDDAALELLKAKDVQQAAPAPAPVAQAASAAPTEPKTLEESVALLPEEHRDAVNAAIEANGKRKEEAIANILAAPGNTFEEKELTAKNLKDVEAIEALVKGNKDDGDNDGDDGAAPDGNNGQSAANFSGKAPAATAPADNAQEDQPLGRPLG